jgi:hypothetical protein
MRQFAILQLGDLAQKMGGVILGSQFDMDQKM